MISAGYFRAKAVSHAFGQTEKGTDYILVTFEIVDEGEAHGQRIRWYGYLSEAAAQRTIESLRHCGWQGDVFEDMTGLDTNEVELVIEDDTYNGESRLKVKWVNPIAVKNALSADRKKELSDRLRNIILSTKANVRASGARPGARGKPKGYPEDWDGTGMPDFE